MRDAREYIYAICDRMKVGERVCFDRRLFEEAYPWGWPSIYGSPIQAFLSSQIGSSWGAWKVTQDPMNGNYTVSHHETGSRRTYVDPDRRHLYEKDEDGFLVLRRSLSHANLDKNEAKVHNEGTHQKEKGATH